MSNEINNDMVEAAEQVRRERLTQTEVRDVAIEDSRDWRYEAIAEAQKRFSLNKADIKQIFGISESTQFRYEKRNPVLKPAIADRLERFHRIYQ